MNDLENGFAVFFEDVTERFFELSKEERTKSCSGKYFDVDWEESCTCNKFMNREELLFCIADRFKQGVKMGCRVYVSRNAVRADEVCDYLNGRIFQEVPSQMRGWVVLVDSTPYESWNHECDYYFFVNREHIFYKKWSRFIVGTVQLEEYKIDI